MKKKHDKDFNLRKEREYIIELAFKEFPNPKDKDIIQFVYNILKVVQLQDQQFFKRFLDLCDNKGEKWVRSEIRKLTGDYLT